MAREFLDIERLDLGYRPERLGDFNEVEVRMSPEDTRIQASRCMNCGIPFCHGSGCPLGNDIPDFNAAVRENRLLDAYNILQQTSPFPEFTSRVCPALCEASCTAGMPSKPVNIRKIEYRIIENAFECGYVKPYSPMRRTGMRVAVVGSGPSGLAAADALNKRGHEVVVFERNQSFGGLLRYGIPDFKLSKQIIERRIDVMRNSGILFESGVEIGADISADYLRRKFDAVCICVGTQIPRGLAPSVKGANTEGIYFALDFLGSQTRFYNKEKDALSISAKDKRVLVIGGGDTGSDCVGTANRQGAKSVTQVEIMPEPPLQRHTSTPWPMWPYQKRTSSSHLEGCTRLWSVNVKSFESRGGSVRSATFVPLEWSFDASGRPKSFVEKTGQEFKIEAELVLLSMGFTGVDKHGIVENLGIRSTERNMIAAGKDAMTNIDGVFACGDCVNGPSLVVRAAKSGLDAAISVDKYLSALIKY